MHHHDSYYISYKPNLFTNLVDWKTKKTSLKMSGLLLIWKCNKNEGMLKVLWSNSHIWNWEHHLYVYLKCEWFILLSALNQVDIKWSIFKKLFRLGHGFHNKAHFQKEKFDVKHWFIDIKMLIRLSGVRL